MFTNKITYHNGMTRVTDDRSSNKLLDIFLMIYWPTVFVIRDLTGILVIDTILN